MMEGKKQVPLIPTRHFWDRYNERFGGVKNLQRILRLIRRSGKWFLDQNGTYACVINNLIICRALKKGERILLVTVFPYTKLYKYKLNRMEKVSSPLQNS